MSIETLTEQILDKMQGLRKPHKKFLIHLFTTLLIVRGRYNLTNIARYSQLTETTLRNWFGKGFNFFAFNTLLLSHCQKQEWVVAFDPSFLSKSGKQTCGIGYFWSGCAGREMRGLEIAGFAAVGLEGETALHLEAKQTVGHGDYSTLLVYYAFMVKHKAEMLKQISNILVADAYFSRKPFVDKVTESGLVLVSKLASNAVLRYRYIGEQSGKGRPKVYGEKVDKLHLDPQHFKLISGEEEAVKIYEGVVNIKALQIFAKCVILHKTNKKGKVKTEVYFSTDTEMDGMKLLRIYRLRFQIEFLYRDGKQHLGLNQSQVRSKEKIHFHTNASLTAVNLAKVCHHLSVPIEERGTFSLADIKSLAFNEHFLQRVFSKFGIDARTSKKSAAYRELVEYGRIAA